MNKSFIALIAAATLIVTSMNARVAHADSDDVAKILLGATAFFVIGAALHDQNKDKNKAPRVTDKPSAQGYKPPAQPNTVALPGRCQRSYALRDGSVHHGFSQRCLQKRYRSARPLPKSCKRSVKTRHYGRVKTYGERCLRKRGYEVAYRH